jgi:diketogulonate reductase-like aldo/keto reductase
MQVHNRRDMAAHWPTILDLKQDGFVRYTGITDYRESANDALMALMRQHRPDFVQINYSLLERGADQALLPLAQELGIAVLINRPFVEGRLFRAVSGLDVPGWAGEFAGSWAQFFLKFIVGHPAVNCVIPATSNVRHMVDNAGAGRGPLPDEAARRRMILFIEKL